MDEFFCGYSYKWMQQFFKSGRPKGIAEAQLYLYAEALCHLYRTKKSTKFKMTHLILDQFHLNRRRHKKYLEYLKNIGIIEVDYKDKASPTITLLLIPPKRNNKNNITHPKNEEKNFSVEKFEASAPAMST